MAFYTATGNLFLILYLNLVLCRDLQNKVIHLWGINCKLLSNLSGHWDILVTMRLKGFNPCLLTCGRYLCRYNVNLILEVKITQMVPLVECFPEKCRYNLILFVHCYRTSLVYEGCRVSQRRMSNDLVIHVTPTNYTHTHAPYFRLHVLKLVTLCLLLFRTLHTCSNTGPVVTHFVGPFVDLIIIHTYTAVFNWKYHNIQIC